MLAKFLLPSSALRVGKRRDYAAQFGKTTKAANEWAAKRINVNAIAPGYISTNNTAVL